MKYLSLDLVVLRKSDTWTEAYRHPWMGFACVNLWAAAAERDGEGIVDDNDVLARLAGIPLDVFIPLKEKIMKAWDLKSGRWTHPVILAEYRRYSKKITGGKKGAKNRWQNNDVDGSPNGSPNGIPNDIANGIPNGYPLTIVKSESKDNPLPPTQNPAPASAPGPLPAAAAVFDRVCTILKIDHAKLRRMPAWINFPATIAGWIEAGCDPDRDIWPTIERLALAKVASGDLPKSPAYFNSGILEARNKRLVANPSGSGMVTPETTSDPHEWSDRLAVWRKSKKWSAKWGPSPDHPGTLVPKFILNHPQGHVHPQYRTPAEPAWTWGSDGQPNWPTAGV